MSRAFLPYGRQTIDDEDIQAVIEVLQSDWLTGGPAVERFEKTVADYLGVPHTVAFSSGTAALHAAMHVAGVKEGDAVVVPPLTFVATANSVVYCGGTPLLADIASDTLCLSPEAARVAIGSSKMPVKAIAPVSYAGFPVDLAGFKELAEGVGALLIEDASHALGAARNGRHVGQEADMTIFSFHPVKHITTAEGGMVVTVSEELAVHLRRFRSHGIVKDRGDFTRHYEGPWDNDMIEMGYNYRLTDLASALGGSQIKKLGGFLDRRREIARLYRKLLGGLKEIKLPPDHPGHAYHLFPIWVDTTIRKYVFEFMRSSGIGVQVHYIPVHFHSYYKDHFSYNEGDFPCAERFSSGEISLPIFPSMSEADVDRVVDTLLEAVRV